MDTDNPELSELPPPDLLWELDWLSIRTAIFRAALELQVWTRIASGTNSAHQIAQEHGWDVTGTCRLLDALCSMKLLDKDERGYQLVPIAKAYLVAGTRNYVGDLLLADMGWEGNGKLADAICTGKRPIVSDWTSGGIGALWASYGKSSYLRPEKAIEGNVEIWRLLDIAATERLRVLDVACGSASMTLALANQNPRVMLTLNDWPAVVDAALAVAEELGIKRQIASLPGDIRTVDFGKDQYDLIWIGDILHFFGPEEIVRTLKRLNQALIPGGLLVVKETVVDEARRENTWLQASLWLFGVSIEGNMYTPSEWTGFLKQAGFADPTPVSREEGLPLWFKASKRQPGQSPTPL
jgi:SAM-dependent methyltransferase